ncbi:MAG: hypothetical protein EON50_01435 [Acidovorax sp.]|nr:MAG: hypothetical protein EON50_01435 [Acidovorax sp.]
MTAQPHSSSHAHATRARWVRLAALAALVSLAACGGGGSADGPAAGADAPSPAPAPAPTPGSPPGPTAPGALSPTYSGEGTFYGATGEGNCSFDASPGNLMVAAMNAPDYAGSAVCGQYVAVTGPKGSVTVRITDQCPECKSGDLDLSESAFARIADPVAERVPIRWEVVPGDVSGPVSYRYKEGSSRWWVAIQVRNHRLPVTGLAIKPSGSADWIAVPRMDYNYFVYPTAIASGPVQVRVTALGGATLIDTLPEPAGGVLTAGAGQFS